jgi:RHS repeat-associated protein
MSRLLLSGPRASVAAITAFVFIGGSLPARAARAGDEPPRAVERAAAPVTTTDPAAGAAPARDVGPASSRLAAGAARVGLTAAAPKTPDSLPVGGDKTGVSSQAISVPQGTAKIQGMGESFSTQISTGVATFSVPISLEHGRGGAQPSLSLSYSSGSGHGVAGVGWDVAVSFIARQTDRGLPLYDDRAAWHPQQDRFVFNGGQELVPICAVPACDASVLLPGEVMPSWASGWQYFRPRVEGAYLRFFWSADHKTWRIESKTGVTMELGAPLDGSAAGALETDPADDTRIFRWDLARQYDDEGPTPPAGAAQPAPVNVAVYLYETVDGMSYLTDIFDTPPPSNPSSAALSAYANHARLLYETRPDATLSYRRGWRVDQTLRLTGIDVTAKAFAFASGPRHAVRRYHLAYDPSFHVSLLTSIQLEGRCASPSAGETAAPTEDAQQALPATTGCTLLPPLTLGYQHVAPFNVDGSSATPDLVGYEGFDERPVAMTGSPPNSIDENVTDLFDINSDGLPDVVVTIPDVNSTFPLYFNGAGGLANTFGASHLGVIGVLGANAGGLTLANDNIAAADLDGDGTINWLHQPAVKSYAVYTPRLVGSSWMMVGRAVPVSALQDPHLDLGEDTPDIDVFDANGDGLVDVVRATGTEMQTFFALGRFPGGDGNFGSAQWTGPASANLSLQFVPSCVPLVSPGVPVRFSDSTIRLGDMNGDGLQDIVYVQQGDLRYWPGRGDGSWGTGPLGSCASGFAADTFIAMSNAPQFSDPNGSGLRIDDVNGDGLDDLVQVRFDAVDVWLNVDGVGWTTNRHIIQGVVPAQGPLWANKVRVVDVNGSGTRDIVWGEGGNYRYMDLSGGERPWVLTHIDNGLGKTTDVTYSTSTAQMLAAEAAGQPWQSKAPMPLHVVSRVVENDNLALVGRPGGTYVTDYTYRDAVYDGRQREFRGFRSAQTRREGDANGPSSTTSSAFLLGECADDEPPPAGLASRCTPEGRWSDNGREALKGLYVTGETFDDSGVYLSGEHHQYTLRKLYTGLDGREVRVAFQSQGDKYVYDTAGFAPNAPSTPAIADVVLDRVPGPEPSTPAPFAVRATSGTAHVLDTTAVDVFGNTTAQVSSGCVGGALVGDPGACPTADDVIVTADVPVLLPELPGNVSGWLWRTQETYVQGSDGVRRKDTTTAYDVNGNPIQTTAQLTGSLPLDRFHAAGGATAGNTAPKASTDGTVTLTVVKYDVFGNSISEAAPNGRCHDIGYASDYADLPTSETIYVGPAGGAGAPTCNAGGGPRGTTALTGTAVYDRGLGAVTNVFDLHNEPSLAQYDELGRIVSLTRSSGASASLSALPSIVLDYDLARPGRPFSILHTQAQVGATEATNLYRNSYAYVDGLGRTIVTVDQADPSAGDAAAWIAEGLTNYDAKGETERKYLGAFFSGDPRAFPLAQVPTAPFRRQRYDAFDRAIESFGLDGVIALQSTYHALSVDKADAEDILPGPHQGTPASARTDGHGRTVAVTERIHNGNAVESRETRTTYLATGEPQVITRVRINAADAPIVRWMAYDTLSRMVLNVEPDATKNFTPTPSPSPPLPAPPATMKAWRYAYDDNGEVVGTSDARGCGANYHYDTGGRLLAEDFSPCIATQEAYSKPDLNSGNGTEAFYQYDALDPDTTNLAFCPTPAFLLGRLAVVFDRGAKTATCYDGRGRITNMARRLPLPGVPSDTLASRYAPHWYTRAIAYDGADRPASATTGADVSQLLDANGQSFVSTQYSLRNAVASVSSGYGPLIASITRDADGLITQTVYGDVASTTSAASYDDRRRPSTVTTFRGAPAIWSSPPATYQPPPAPNGPPSTFQRLLEDVDYVYDEVDNPVEVRDFRNPAEWPAGAQPASRKIQYDDLYRATQVEYEYPAGTDPWTSPFDAEDRGIDADPRHAQPSPHTSFANRVLRQSLQYDWLGNTTATDDDVHGFYDRSLGTVTNGTAALGPYQLKAASGAGTLGGSLSATYDDAGNLTALTVSRSGPCLPAGASCSQRFTYDWDEVGRLVHARRFDGTATAASADLVYAYDTSDDRTLKTATDAQGHQVHSAYVFNSLELRRTTFNGTEYARTPTTEVGYLFAHGVRLARLHFAESGVGFAAPGSGGGGGGGGADAGTSFSITGVATNAQGGPVSGATIQITGSANKTATTNAAGSYAFTGLGAGSYAITATLANCTFTPNQVHFNNITTSQVENLVGSGSGCGTATGIPPAPLPLTISGRVTDSSGIGVVGISIQLNGSAQGTAVTDGVGNYVFGGLQPGSYSLALSGTSCTVTPASANINNITTSVIQNFTASGTGCVLGGTPDPTTGGSQLHVLFELPDHLGSTSIVVDRDTSEVVERGAYMAYGQADSDYRPARWDSFREDYRFTGKEEDVEVGLDYFGKRFFAPGLGRWASADPLTVHTYGADANAYAYVSGRLLAATDRAGLAGSGTGGMDAGEGAPPGLDGAHGRPGFYAEPSVDVSQPAYKAPLGSTTGFGGVTSAIQQKLFDFWMNTIAGIYGLKESIRQEPQYAPVTLARALVEGPVKSAFGLHTFTDGIESAWKANDSYGRTLGVLTSAGGGLQLVLTGAMARGLDVPTFASQGRGGLTFSERGAAGAGGASARLRLMGKNPGKWDPTGLKVQARMQAEGNLLRFGDRTMIRYYDASIDRYAWMDMRYTDMAHRIDAVSWWNSEGIKFGPKSPEVRAFMLNPDHYELQPLSINRSKGALLKEVYLEF